MRPTYLSEVTNSFVFRSSASRSEGVELSVPLVLGAVIWGFSMHLPVAEPLGTRFRVAFGIVDAKTKRHETFAVKFTDPKVLSIRTKQPLSGILPMSQPLCSLNFEKLLKRHKCSNLYMMLCIT